MPVQDNHPLLTFRASRKHFLRDRTYYVHITHDQICMSENKLLTDPKYKLKVDLNLKLGWVVKLNNNAQTLVAFIFMYRGNNKEMHSDHESLKRMKNFLSGRVLYYQISDFYTPQKVIGTGSFANVIICQSTQSQSFYAVKAIKKDCIESNTSNFEIFANEVKIMRQLTEFQNGRNDTYFVNQYEIFNGTTTYYVIMDLLEGKSLEAEIDSLREKNQTLDKESIKLIMRQLLQGVSFMHELGIIHRDLKPDNIMFKRPYDYSTLRIIDFGLATYVDISKYYFQKCGTPGYVAPEILHGVEKYAYKVDAFSCGSIFYFLLTGHHLFKGSSFEKVLKANKKCIINFESPEFIRMSQDEITLLQGLLTKNPDQRLSVKEALQMPYFRDDQLIGTKYRPQSDLNGILYLEKIEELNQQEEQQSDVDQESPPKKNSQDLSIMDERNDYAVLMYNFPTIAKPSLEVKVSVTVSVEHQENQIAQQINSFNSINSMGVIKSFYYKQPLSQHQKHDYQLHSSLLGGDSITQPQRMIQSPLKLLTKNISSKETSKESDHQEQLELQSPFAIKLHQNRVKSKSKYNVQAKDEQIHNYYMQHKRR